MDDLQRFMNKIKVNEFGERRDCTCKVPFARKETRITWRGKRLRAYQVAFVIEFGFLPNEISHRCHRRKCVEITHLLNETSNMNKSRNKCKRKLEKKKNIWKRKVRKVKQCYTLRLEECNHEPSCFLNIGKV
jgi:hypothetical protein